VFAPQSRVIASTVVEDVYMVVEDGGVIQGFSIP
jgi:hypothetical protein